MWYSEYLFYCFVNNVEICSICAFNVSNCICFYKRFLRKNVLKLKKFSACLSVRVSASGTIILHSFIYFVSSKRPASICNFLTF